MPLPDHNERQQHARSVGRRTSKRRTMPAGNPRASLQHRWSDEKEKEAWYAGGFAYWSGEAATNDGMLGGFADVDAADTADSLKFMRRCGALPESQRNGGRRVVRALDVGAGIGRVTSGTLLQLTDTVDLLESDAKFVERAKGALAWAAPRVERFHCQPMQDFVPETGRYDLIWIQWCVGCLTLALTLTLPLTLTLALTLTLTLTRWSRCCASSPPRPT